MGSSALSDGSFASVFAVYFHTRLLRIFLLLSLPSANKVRYFSGEMRLFYACLPRLINLSRFLLGGQKGS
jgi:hypothetical protein